MKNEEREFRLVCCYSPLLAHGREERICNWFFDDAYWQLDALRCNSSRRARNTPFSLHASDEPTGMADRSSDGPEENKRHSAREAKACTRR